MSCEAHCCGLEKLFDEKHARKQMKRYHRRGTVGATRKLLTLLSEVDITGRTLLDIGGGVGVIQRELMNAGVASAMDVDSSQGSIRVAQQEAERQNHPTMFLHGDFTKLADQIEAADIVTLDKVICCYPNVDDLLTKALDKTKAYVGLVLPRDSVIARVVLFIGNIAMRLTGNGFRSYMHSPLLVHSMIENRGFLRIGKDRTNAWHVWLYGRYDR